MGETTIAYYPLLTVLAPLLAALIIFLFEGSVGHKAYKIGALVQAVALGVSIQILYGVGAEGAVAIRVPLLFSSGVLQFGLYIDRLAAIMMTLIIGISLIISLFSARYMQQENGRVRFHILLGLTTFTLLSMVSSNNLLMLFVFWQLLSWFLYLLSYHHSHLPTVRCAFNTYTFMRIGDISFLSGIVLAYRLYGTLDFQQLFVRAAEASATFSLWPGGGLEISAVTAITLLIFIGAMSKSAQFPMHFWLPGSLYAPTPVSALLHAGIINAGGFLLNRLAPLYGLSPSTLHFVLLIGMLTTLLGAGMMLAQSDIRMTLGHSTIGQMGYMIMECGLGAFALAVFHLIAHGLFKATAFLNSGNVINAARQEPRHPAPDPKNVAMERTEFSSPEFSNLNFSSLTWGAGFIMTLILPLIILLAAHGALRLPLVDSQGTIIFLFFSWVTSAQAILTLYRLQAVASWRVASVMFITLLVVVVTYLFAAERFTQFLYPAPGEVASYFQSAALPGRLFDFLVLVTALSIILGWIFIYAKNHGLSIRTPAWVNALYIRLYILFMNRLYLEASYFKLGQRFTRIVRLLNEGVLFRYILGLIAFATALGLLLPAAGRLGDLSAVNILLFFIAALMLPLFPLHGVYMAALTRFSGYLPTLFSILLPVLGLYAAKNLLPETTAEVRSGMAALALFGAIYGSLMASVQHRVERLLAYAGLTLFSILWWYLAVTGSYTQQAAIYAGAAVLITGGLFLSWQFVRVRYGNLHLNRIGGLAQTMPRLAFLLSLLVMAAMGLPPFGLFSGFMEMMLNRSIPPSWDLAVILPAWLAASWFFLILMQRLLFGPHRGDILYSDLRPSEASLLVIVLIILLAMGIAPYGFSESDTVTQTSAVILWQK